MTIYALADAADEARKPVYVGRTRRGIETRLKWHRTARRATWLKTSNPELSEWLESTVPAAIVLDEVTQDGTEWDTERAWIEKYADCGIFNIVGNPLRAPWASRRWPCVLPSRHDFSLALARARGERRPRPRLSPRAGPSQ